MNTQVHSTEPSGEAVQRAAGEGAVHVFVTLRISPTIASEFASRCPDDIPESCYRTGSVSVTVEDAKLLLADAEFNSDRSAFDIGEYGMPLPIFNAYRALAKQIRAALAKGGAA